MSSNLVLSNITYIHYCTGLLMKTGAEIKDESSGDLWRNTEPMRTACKHKTEPKGYSDMWSQGSRQRGMKKRRRY